MHGIKGNSEVRLPPEGGSLRTMIKIMVNALGILMGMLSLVLLLADESNTYVIPIGTMFLALFIGFIANRIGFYIEESKQKKLNSRWEIRV